MILASKAGKAKRKNTRKKSDRVYVLLHRFIRIAPVHRFGNCTGQFKGFKGYDSSLLRLLNSFNDQYLDGSVISITKFLCVWNLSCAMLCISCVKAGYILMVTNEIKQEPVERVE